MKLTGKILLSAGIVLVAIQFIQPARNKSELTSETDISKAMNVPDNVQGIIKKACYDCHSNNTEYPWYSYIQPAGWFLAGHIKKAREELNFSEFGGYTARRQSGKLDQIANEIRDNGMPLPSYRLMHKNARLSQEEKTLLTDWAEQSKTGITAEP